MRQDSDFLKEILSDLFPATARSAACLQRRRRASFFLLFIENQLSVSRQPQAVNLPFVLHKNFGRSLCEVSKTDGRNWGLTDGGSLRLCFLVVHGRATVWKIVERSSSTTSLAISGHKKSTDWLAESFCDRYLNETESQYQRKFIKTQNASHAFPCSQPAT